MKKTISIAELWPFFRFKPLQPICFFLERLLCIEHLNNMMMEVQRRYPDSLSSAFAHATQITGHKIEYAADQLLRIPRTGPCIIVANHDAGLLDIVAIIHVISKIRVDYKFTANSILQTIPEWREFTIPVHVMSQSPKDAIKQNSKSIKECIEWLNSDHVLITFPGSVPSSANKIKRQQENVWSSLPILLANKTQAPIIPVKITTPDPLMYKLMKKYFMKLRLLAHLRIFFYYYKKNPAKLSIGNTFCLSNTLTKQQTLTALKGAVMSLNTEC